MHFDLNDLKVFICVADASSLTQGAKAAFITPAAASNRIKYLEEQLNSRLFFRLSTGMELTPAGYKLLDHARKMLQYADTIRAEFSDFQADAHGHIRLVANTTALISFLPEILAQFLSNRPEVSIDLRENANEHIIRNVRDGSSDIGILSKNINVHDLETIHFSTDRLCVAISPNHVLHNKSSVTLKEALLYPQISLYSGSTLRKFIDDHMENLGIVPKTRINLSSFEAVCRLVEVGVGIAIVPESVLARHLKTMQLQAIKLDDDSAVRERCIIVKEYDGLAPVSRALIEQIIQSTRSSPSSPD